MVFCGHVSVLISPPQLGPILKGRMQSGNTLHDPTPVHLGIRHAFAEVQDSSPVKSPMRKKSTFQGSFHYDDDYQFAPTVQESFKTSPPGFNTEEFEHTPIVGGEIRAWKSSAAGEQLIQATSAKGTPQASNLNLHTLATALSLLKKLRLE